MDDAAFERLTADLLDGHPVDWARLEHDGALDPARLRALRTLARIAEAHRGGTPAPPECWGPYELVEPIAHGAYGEVWRAHDPQLDRAIALKVLPAGTDEDAQAVLNEGRLLARVRHPNVATVYAVTRVGDEIGVAMELVEGDDLETIVRREGPLPQSVVEEVARQLLSALDAVHRAGVLHRDIKAANVKRASNGRVVLLDFGSSRELRAHPGTGPEAGTPLCVAPEVLRGAPASVRSDLYAAGALLFFLATGRHPVEAHSLDELKRGHDDRKSRRRTLPSIPGLSSRAVHAIAAALDPEPARRPASAGDMAERLRPRAARRLVAASVVLLALAAAAAYGAWRMRPVPAAATTPSWVLVGPFDNNTGDRRLDEVLRFALRQGLSESRSLRIVSEERIGDALALMERPRDTRIDRPLAREVALRDGGIRYFTTGRVDRIGSHYALGATLFDAQSGAPVLTAGADLVDVDDALAGIRTLAARLRTAAGENRRQVRSDLQLERVTTNSLDALGAYSRGVQLMNRRDSPSAEVQFREAIRQDPNFASAHVMLAYAAFNEKRPRSTYLPLVDRALQLSAGLPARERLFITASHAQLHGELEQAIPGYTALLTEFPDDYWSANNLAIIYDELGRGPEALPYYYLTADDRPNNFEDVIYSAVKALNTTGDWATAKSYAARARTLPSRPQSPGVPWLELLPAFELWTQDRITEAAARLDDVASHLPMRAWDPIEVGHLQLGLGRVQAAVEAFRDHPVAIQQHEFVAEALLARGDVTGARRELQQDPAIYDPAAVPGNWHYIIHELCGAGLIREAEALLQRATGPDHVQNQVIWPAFLAEARGEVLAATHRDAEAIAVLDGARRMMLPGRELMWTDEALADVLVRRGDLERAASLLRPLRNVRSQLDWLSASGIYPWLRVRAQLAGIERQLGHEDAARAIEAEVRPLLAVADPDFVVRRTIE